ncbi:hypothetical protein NODU109028_05400 [Nocardioides dubius]|uniref:Dihydroorotate dehydrogenase electron transfer subunit n=1 Tax=Nocardioides dubius TaxID=317019 RepID=A0ABN1TR71_9ACTN
MSAHVPIQIAAEVVAIKRVGALRQLTLTAPGVAELFRPGNVVSLVLPGGARLARRSYWVHRVSPVGPRGPSLELIVEPRGVAGSWLASREPGHQVAMIGPLGRPFAQPREPVTCVLVGDGVHAAPLVPLAERLRERGCVVHVLLAAPTEAQLAGVVDVRRFARSVQVVTGDGSIGARGGIADVLPELIARTAAEVVYAAGEVPAMHDVARIAEASGAWSQVGLRLDQPCGTGLCHGCPVPVAGEDGAPRTVRACVEGPVFRGDRVRWADL